MGKKDQEGPQPPKRPLSGFFLFKNDVFAEVKKENPDKKVTQLTQIISEKWRAIDDKTKAKYDEMQQQAKADYEKEKKKFEEEHGPIESKKRKSKGAAKGKKGKKGSDDEDDESDGESDDSEDNKKKKGKGKKK